VYIKGICLGHHAPISGADTPDLLITDKSGGWGACTTSKRGSDTVTCNISSWTDSEIVFTGFTGWYNEFGYTVAAGQIIEVQITNPQSNLGPSTAVVTAGHPYVAPAPKVKPSTSSGDQSSIAASLVTPSDALGSVRHDVAVLALAGAATLFIAFPAQLFNHVFQENYDEIVDMARRRLRGVIGAGKRLAKISARARFALVVLAGAWLGALLDPSFGVSWKSLETYLAMILSTATGISVTTYVALRYRRHQHKGLEFSPHALPLGLLIAAACVIVSRLSSFEPGYLYGVVAGVVFADELTERQEAHTATLSALGTLGAATLAWFCWDLLNRHASHAGVDVPLVVADDALAAIFAGGLTGTVISLLPLRFLPGGRIAKWHKGAWTAVFVTAVFGLIDVLLWPRRNAHAGGAPLATILVLFVAFGGGSVALWWYFERRKRIATTPDVAAAAIARAPEAIEAEPSSTPQSTTATVTETVGVQLDEASPQASTSGITPSEE
jgi:hypothetical protein